MPCSSLIVSNDTSLGSNTAMSNKIVNTVFNYKYSKGVASDGQASIIGE